MAKRLAVTAVSFIVGAVGPLVLALSAVAGALPGTAAAETIVEQYRSPWGIPRLVATNSSDGSVWVASATTMLHLDGSGNLLSQTDGLLRPQALAVGAADGACWVAESNGRITKLSAEGEVQWRRGGYSSLLMIAVDDGDGSAWVADDGPQDAVHLDADGTELVRINLAEWFPRGPYWPGVGGRFFAIAVDSVRGLCVVAGERGDTADRQGSSVVLDRDGGIAPDTWGAGGYGPIIALASDPADGTIWGTTGGSANRWGYPGEVEPLWVDVYEAQSIAVNPNDGSCWVACGNGLLSGDVWHIGAEGQILWRGEQDDNSVSIAVSPADDSVWVVQAGEGRLVHLSRDGTRVAVDPGEQARRIAVNQTDRSVWVGGTGQVSHYDRNAVALGSISPFGAITSLAVNSADGSCWVSDGWPDADARYLEHLAADGSALPVAYRRTAKLSVDPTDGSCWLAEWDRFSHVDADGNWLWSSPTQLDLHGTPVAVAVNPTDSSCWYTTYATPHIGRYDASGNLLWQLDGRTGCLSVNPTDHSCWVGDGPAHLAADGTVLWSDTRYGLTSISVNASDGSVWGLESGTGRVLHWAADGTLRGRYDGLLGAPAHRTYDPQWDLSVDPADGSVWAVDSGQLVHLVLRPSAAPTASFEAGPLTGPVPLRVGFTDTSEGNVTSYLWDFGDGATATAPNPSHSYEIAGVYTVSLTVTDPTGMDVLTKASLIAVTGPPPPVADFSAEPTTGPAPLEVVFFDLSTNGPTNWVWDFGDGTTASTKDAVHTYPTAGRYTVSLTAGNAGGWGTITRQDCVEVTFADVPADSWALDAILACVAAGIVQGYWDGTYHPERTVTRDQMAVYLSRAVAGSDAGVQVPSGVVEPTFSDVPADHWAYRYVEYCAGNGLVQGYPGGSYHPDEAVNRGQMAVYIARALAGGDDGVPAHTTEPTFTDVTPSNDWAWCYDHVEYCAAAGIVQGYWDGKYHPEREVTRDQMAVYVARAFDLPM